MVYTQISQCIKHGNTVRSHDQSSIKMLQRHSTATFTCLRDNVLMLQGDVVSYLSLLEVKGSNVCSPCGFRATSIVCEISPLLSYAGEVSSSFFFANNATR